MNRVTKLSDPDDSNILTFEEGADTEFSSDLQEPIFLPAHDEFDEEVAKAQEQLEDLRRQQAEIERQKNELEHLRVRQAEFQRGRVEMIENLQHSLDVLDRDAFDAEHRLEQYNRAKESFTNHLDIIANLRPESWARDELKFELEHAAKQVEDAREEYLRMLAHMDALPPESALLAASIPALSHAGAKVVETAATDCAAGMQLGVAETRNFSYWLRSGFAFTLPLLVFGFFALMLMLLFG